MKQKNNDSCYCDTSSFENCCQPYIKGFAKAPTAEALMRSRYSHMQLRMLII